MWPDCVSNPRTLPLESDALPTALCGQAFNKGENVYKHFASLIGKTSPVVATFVGRTCSLEFALFREQIKESKFFPIWLPSMRRGEICLY